MFWGSRQNDEPRPENENTSDSKPLQREKLPPHLQKLVDREDNFFDDVYSSYSVDSTDTPYRYAGYANRVRTILLSAHRYVAYTSDIGESFRPVAHPWLVRAAYGVSWTYLLGDVCHEGYKAYLRNRRVLAPPCEAYKDAKDLSHSHVAKGMVTGNISGSLTSSPSPPGESELIPWPTTRIPLIEDYRVVMAKRAVFQSIASMGLPAFTIHSVVKYSGRMFKTSKSTFLRTWAPIGLGLSVVPFLPYIFDEPVGEAVEWSFRTAIRAYAGEDDVRPLPELHKSTSKDSVRVSEFLKQHGSEALSEAKAETQKLTSSAKISWDEYKEEKQREREQRKRERQEQGKNGLFGFFGSSSDSGKSKTE